MDAALPKTTLIMIIVGMALLQILVQLGYFLHMNTRSEGGWNLLSIMFTLILVVILLAGTLWVMHHMNANMMPMTEHDARMVD